MKTLPCPCQSGQVYAECCEPFHRGAARAATAELLMRSRFSAYAVGDVGYVRRSWHATTRPPDLVLDDDVRWYRLEVLGSSRGGVFDTEGTVEFRAHYRANGARGSQHEVSRFVREGGEWLYLDAVLTRAR
ncbi:YchJ family protein [Pengzhenrongella sp.]|uniref:YchJ family protein n=1 Tax=Pengzhenrongella sp. TaxID=2888820 RepID=UPI002F931CC1